jgi:hypothetical protein
MKQVYRKALALVSMMLIQVYATDNVSVALLKPTRSEVTTPAACPSACELEKKVKNLEIEFAGRLERLEHRVRSLGAKFESMSDQISRLEHQSIKAQTLDDDQPKLQPVTAVAASGEAQSEESESVAAPLAAAPTTLATAEETTAMPKDHENGATLSEAPLALPTDSSDEASQSTTTL